MIAYIYNKYTKTVVFIAENVTSIIGDTVSYDTNKSFKPIGGKFDFIVLENAIDIVVGDTIDISLYTDLRDYLLLSKEEMDIKTLKAENLLLGQSVTDRELANIELGQAVTDLELRIIALEGGLL